MPGLIVTEAVRALARCHPQLTVNVLRTNWDDQTDVLHDGRADVSYIRLPVDQSGLQVQPLLAEPRVAVFPSGHRLAGKDTVSIADLANEHLLQDPGAVPEWRDIAAEMRTRHRPSVPVFRTVEEKLEHVAAGHGIVLLPLSTAVFYTRPGVAHSHVSDIPLNQVCLAWDATRRSPSRTSPPSPPTTRPSPAGPNRAASRLPGRRRPPRQARGGWTSPGKGRVLTPAAARDRASRSTGPAVQPAVNGHAASNRKGRFPGVRPPAGYPGGLPQPGISNPASCHIRADHRQPDRYWTLRPGRPAS